MLDIGVNFKVNIDVKGFIFSADNNSGFKRLLSVKLFTFIILLLFINVFLVII